MGETLDDEIYRNPVECIDRQNQWVATQPGGTPMERHSEFPIFVQSAVAIVGFLLLLSLIGWMFEAKGQLHQSYTPSSEVAAVH
jgi:hypothetical protein